MNFLAILAKSVDASMYFMPRFFSCATKNGTASGLHRFTKHILSYTSATIAAVTALSTISAQRTSAITLIRTVRFPIENSSLLS